MEDFLNKVSYAACESEEIEEVCKKLQDLHNSMLFEGPKAQIQELLDHFDLVQRQNADFVMRKTREELRKD